MDFTLMFPAQDSTIQPGMFCLVEWQVVTAFHIHSQQPTMKEEKKEETTAEKEGNWERERESGKWETKEKKDITKKRVRKGTFLQNNIHI